MRRRSRAGGERAKPQRHKAVKPKRRSAPESVGQETELARRIRERDEALERETATAEVLNVISLSAGDLKSVFDAILENATRLCEAKFGILLTYQNDLFHPVAHRSTPTALLEFLNQRGPFRPPRGTSLDQVLKTNSFVHRADDSVHQTPSSPARLGGAKSHLAVPMFKNRALVGAIMIYRQEVRPFTDKQIALVQNFAAQAVIAIENTRLLKELRQRTEDLSESLEQQTATSEILKVISSSPGELNRVFEVMLENATRICESKFANLLLCDGSAFRVAATFGAPEGWAEFRGRVPLIRLTDHDPLGRVVSTKRLVHITDTRSEQAYISREPQFVPLVEVAGARSLLIVPMLKESELVGALGIYRQEVRPFTDKQIALVQNFAAQAVIAIENTW